MNNDKPDLLAIKKTCIYSHIHQMHKNDSGRKSPNAHISDAQLSCVFLWMFSRVAYVYTISHRQEKIFSLICARRYL